MGKKKLETSLSENQSPEDLRKRILEILEDDKILSAYQIMALIVEVGKVFHESKYSYVRIISLITEYPDQSSDVRELMKDGEEIIGEACDTVSSKVSSYGSGREFSPTQTAKVTTYNKLVLVGKPNNS